MIRLKRADKRPSPTDGYRVLVDQKWPDELSEDDLELNEWLKDVAPSKDLRRWFDHDPDKFDEFRDKYKQELRESDATKELQSVLAQHNLVTFVYSAKDKQYNHAVVLKEFADNLF